MIIEFLLFVTFFVLLLFKFNQKPKGLPPGMWGLPIIGIIPGGRAKFDYLIEYHEKKYGGGIYCTKLGTRATVFITDFRILKNAFQKLEFSARPNFHSVFTMGENLGVSMASGPIWHTNRRFALKVLKDYGMGKSKMESIIEREVISIIDYYDKFAGKPVELGFALNVAVINVLWSIVSNRRYDLDDPRIYKFTEMNHENFALLRGRLLTLDLYPKTLYLPTFIKDTLLQAGILKKNREVFKNYLMEIINEHVEKLDKENPQNFIDMYLTEVQDDPAPENEFRKNLYNLAHTLINFFTGGSDSTSSSIRWLIYYLTIHQDWQEKVQKQLDEHIPRERIAHYSDKDKLPLLEACVNESLRKASLTQMAIPHATTEDVTLEGYHIPQGSVIIGCPEKCHGDPKYWERPDEFYPKHFLNEDGTLNGQKEGFAPFSIGKRMCPGEILAKMDMFMFGAALLQRYKITPAPGEVMTYEADKSSTFFNFPKMYKLVLEKRI